MHYIIKKPLVTEKNSIMAETGVYAFEVNNTATKTEVKEAIEKFFRVKVAKVRTQNCRGRMSKNKFGSGRVQYWKKALVQLKPGEKISLFEGA